MTCVGGLAMGAFFFFFFLGNRLSNTFLTLAVMQPCIMYILYKIYIYDPLGWNNERLNSFFSFFFFWESWKTRWWWKSTPKTFTCLANVYSFFFLCYQMCAYILEGKILLYISLYKPIKCANHDFEVQNWDFK